MPFFFFTEKVTSGSFHLTVMTLHCRPEVRILHNQRQKKPDFQIMCVTATVENRNDKHNVLYTYFLFLVTPNMPTAIRDTMHLFLFCKTHFDSA